MLKSWKNFLIEEDGMGTVEIILIIVVLVGLVIVFKSQLTQEFYRRIFADIIF